MEVIKILKPTQNYILDKMNWENYIKIINSLMASNKKFNY